MEHGDNLSLNRSLSQIAISVLIFGIGLIAACWPLMVTPSSTIPALKPDDAKPWLDAMAADQAWVSSWRVQGGLAFQNMLAGGGQCLSALPKDPGGHPGLFASFLCGAKCGVEFRAILALLAGMIGIAWLGRLLLGFSWPAAASAAAFLAGIAPIKRWMLTDPSGLESLWIVPAAVIFFWGRGKPRYALVSSLFVAMSFIFSGSFASVIFIVLFAAGMAMFLKEDGKQKPLTGLLVLISATVGLVSFRLLPSAFYLAEKANFHMEGSAVWGPIASIDAALPYGLPTWAAIFIFPAAVNGALCGARRGRMILSVLIASIILGSLPPIHVHKPLSIIGPMLDQALDNPAYIMSLGLGISMALSLGMLVEELIIILSRFKLGLAPPVLALCWLIPSFDHVPIASVSGPGADFFKACLNGCSQSMAAESFYKMEPDHRLHPFFRLKEEVGAWDMYEGLFPKTSPVTEVTYRAGKGWVRDGVNKKPVAACRICKLDKIFAGPRHLTALISDGDKKPVVIFNRNYDEGWKGKAVKVTSVQNKLGVEPLNEKKLIYLQHRPFPLFLGIGLTLATFLLIFIEGIGAIIYEKAFKKSTNF